MKRAFQTLAIILLGIYLWNASWLAPKPDGKAELFLHRGYHQIYSRENLERDDCTATRIKPPVHDYLENTIPSIRASFDAGMDAVEIDIHPTTDGEFVVFHDWTLECRTDGEGITREKDLAYLQSLDVGYGYTADGGTSYPFRGKFVGAMPSLKEVLETFPDQKFLINFKSRDANEATLLDEYFTQYGLSREHLSFYGDAAPIDALHALWPENYSFSKAAVKSCTIRYAIYGWTGIVPKACKGKTIIAPLNYRYLLWGWPNRFLARMDKAGVNVFLIGYIDRKGFWGLKKKSELKKIPEEFNGIIWLENWPLLED